MGIISRKKAGTLIVRIIVVLVLMFIAGEVFLRILYPQVIECPRPEYELGYCFMLPRNKRIVHKRPGEWEFVYTINEDRCRGARVPVSNTYAETNIIVLGDSYAMGVGVNDGEEFSAVLGDLLGPGYNVINTGCPGWGLTQEIRRYYEFGQLYDPELVVLQFCGNDPIDNLGYRAARVEGDRFVFQNAAGRGILLARLLSQSALIQHSQLYNFIKSLIVARRNARLREALSATPGEPAPSGDAVPRKESYYNELVSLFARDLHRRGVRLIIIAVGDELGAFPHIKSNVDALHAAGLCDCYETAHWFEGLRDLRSPEGHRWGVKAHRIIAERLAQVIEEAPLESD